MAGTELTLMERIDGKGSTQIGCRSDGTSFERIFAVSCDKLMSFSAFIWVYRQYRQIKSWLEKTGAWQAMRRLSGAIRTYRRELSDAPKAGSDFVRPTVSCRRAKKGTQGYWTPMPHFFKRSIAFWSCSFLIFLSGCSAKPECESFETRDAVLKAVSNDHNNSLGRYAAENSATAKPNDASSESEKARQQPLYLLGETIVTTSTSKDKRTLTCSGSMSVTVGDTKASKQIDFTVQQLSDGKLSVSVTPFQF